MEEKFLIDGNGNLRLFRIAIIILALAAAYTLGIGIIIKRAKDVPCDYEACVPVYGGIIISDENPEIVFKNPAGNTSILMQYALTCAEGDINNI